MFEKIYNLCIFCVQVIKDENNTERALKTTPQQLEISQSEIIGGGNGVWTKCAIPPRVVFGPYEGVVSSLPDKLGYSWTVFDLSICIN